VRAGCVGATRARRRRRRRARREGEGGDRGSNEGRRGQREEISRGEDGLEERSEACVEGKGRWGESGIGDLSELERLTTVDDDGVDDARRRD